MRKFLIERHVPGAASMAPQQMQAVAAKSKQVLDQLAPDVQWQQSFVTDDHIFCVYFAKDADVVRKHADLAGLPANQIIEVRNVVDPAALAA